MSERLRQNLKKLVAASTLIAVGAVASEAHTKILADNPKSEIRLKIARSCLPLLQEAYPEDTPTNLDTTDEQLRLALLANHGKSLQSDTGQESSLSLLMATPDGRALMSHMIFDVDAEGNVRLNCDK